MGFLTRGAKAVEAGRPRPANNAGTGSDLGSPGTWKRCSAAMLTLSYRWKTWLITQTPRPPGGVHHRCQRQQRPHHACRLTGAMWQ